MKIVLCQEMAFSLCRYLLKNNWRVHWVHLSQVWGLVLLAIIFYHEGLSLAQISSLGNKPLPRSLKEYAPYLYRWSLLQRSDDKLAYWRTIVRKIFTFSSIKSHRLIEFLNSERYPHGIWVIHAWWRVKIYENCFITVSIQKTKFVWKCLVWEKWSFSSWQNP